MTRVLSRSQPPAVLHLVNSFAEGGTERQAVQLANALHVTGQWKVSIALLDAYGPLRATLAADLLNDCDLYPLHGFARWQTLRELERFVRRLRRDRVSVVHTHGFYPNVFGMVAAALAGVPVRIASKRESVKLRTPARARLERAAFALATRLLANCDAVKAEMVASGTAAARVAVIHNALHPQRAAGSRARSTSRGEALEASAGRVVMVANFHHEAKDHATLLRAARRVVDHSPEIQFELVGDGPLRSTVQALSRALDLERHVLFSGACDDIPALLERADVCVLTSRLEGFPNVILEYMGAGRAVVATDAGGVREAVVDGVTGRLIEPGDDAAMAAALLRLLEDAALRDSMGAAGRERVLRDFSLPLQVERISTLYRTELEGLAVRRR